MSKPSFQDSQRSESAKLFQYGQSLFELCRYKDAEDTMRTGKTAPITTGDLLDAIHKQRPTTTEWFETARNYATYANEGGLYDDVLAYLKTKRP